MRMDRSLSYLLLISWGTFTHLMVLARMMTALKILGVTLALIIMINIQVAVDTMRLMISTLQLNAALVEVETQLHQEDNLTGEEHL